MNLPRYQSNIDISSLSDNHDGFCIYDDGKLTYRLSQTAVQLASFCDGEHTIEDIINLRCTQLPDKDKEHLKLDVIERMNDLLDKGLIKENVNDSEDWNAPLLITGSARSGSSALTRSLSSHSNFCLFNEYSLFHQFNSNLDTWHRIQWMGEENPPPKKISSDMETLKRKMLEELPLHTSNVSTKNWLFDTVENRPQIYGDKMPYTYLAKMHEIVEKHPDVRFLITLRDGRAVVASQIRQYNKSIENGDTPPKWAKPSVQEAQYLWLRSANNWIHMRSNPPAPCLEVRYEQATQSPEILVKEICAFVDIEYRAKDFHEFFRRYQPVHADTWREEIENIEGQLSSEFLDALNQLGYE